MVYDSYVASGSSQSSGAYIFRPKGDAYFLDKVTNSVNASWRNSISNLVSEVYQVLLLKNKKNE